MTVQNLSAAQLLGMLKKRLEVLNRKAKILLDNENLSDAQRSSLADDVYVASAGITEVARLIERKFHKS